MARKRVRRSRRTRRQSWAQPWKTEPVVSTLPRAANLLGVDLDELRRRVEQAGLEPWPTTHQDGSAVYPWAQLRELVEQQR